MPKAKSWSLICVTYGGELRVTHGYPTLAMCEEAKSLALTGMTIAQNAAADKKYADYQAEQIDTCRTIYPPRPPTDDERKRFKPNHRYYGYADNPYRIPGLYVVLRDDGLVHRGSAGISGCSPSYGPGEAMEFVRGSWVRKTAGHVKTAECVPA
jgi:hypothetical protein